jgi:acetyl esterase/lipase
VRDEVCLKLPSFFSNPIPNSWFHQLRITETTSVNARRQIMHEQTDLRYLTYIALAIVICWSSSSVAQEKVISLWPGVAAGSENWTQQETESPDFWTPTNPPVIRNVVHPAITVILPEKSKATGTAVIVAPGGGFSALAIQPEGFQVAQWLADRGVAAFVLKYRLRNTGTEEESLKHNQEIRAKVMQSADPVRLLEEDAEIQKVIPLAAEDGRQAVRLVRQHAAEWGIAADRIGFMGFSAGGRVTEDIALRHDAQSRPDFVAPIYPPPLSLIPVPGDAAPMFLLCAADDPIAAKSITQQYQDWHAAGKSVELHIYSKGGHGFGAKKQGLPVNDWLERFYEWMNAQGLLASRK